MNTHTTEQLLMCEKTDLVKYIEELKQWSLSKDMIETTSAETIEEFERDVRDNWTELEELKEQNENLENMLGESYSKHDVYDLKEELKISAEQARVYGDKLLEKEDEIKKLKKANDTFTLGAKRAIESNCKLYKENEELKKRGEESLQLTMSQNEKFMDELEEKNKVIDTLKEEHHSVWVKLNNANVLYKGYACSVLTTDIQHDICEQCMGQIFMNAPWLSKFLQEKFYEEIVPDLINEITEDGMYGFGGNGDMYEIEHNGKGCISITYVERSSSDEDDDE